MSWENIFKVKVQGSTLRLLLSHAHIPITNDVSINCIGEMHRTAFKMTQSSSIEYWLPFCEVLDFICIL